MLVGQLLLNLLLFCGFTAKAAMFTARGYGKEYTVVCLDGFRGG